uniref:Uncharacterized protein n=1 Tax=Anguilla anguilla TaxID=7936 RepID=A0A0E9S9K4_ANGAN
MNTCETTPNNTQLKQRRKHCSDL